MSQDRPHPEGGGPSKRGIGSGETPAAASTRLQAIRIALSHDLTRAGRVLERRGMVVATEGNLSARLTPERFLISRRGRRKGELKSRDYVEVPVVESPETPVPLNASSEYRVHRAAYRARRDADAVLHAHPISLTAYAVRGLLPDFTRFDEGRIFVGPMVLVQHFPAGSDALAEAVERALVEPTRPSLVLMQNHGALSVGQSVDEALSRLEVAEHLAATLIAAGRIPG